MSLFRWFKCVARSINQLLIGQQEIKEIIMGMKEDFDKFVKDVNARTNEIGEALTEIQADIERLISSGANTPPEIVTEMEAVNAKLAALAASSTAIAALDNPVVPPVEEPPL
jgi:methyl-accepting chemotaxis protein